jgi:hypothetical protein
MHNRVRMLAASFLVKHLMIPWQEGAAWFWDTLVDADLANNTMGWQWSAGCGADAAPYFRIFNPVIQGERFDPDGEYVRRWVPELARVPNQWIHKPWEAVGACRGRGLGKKYPRPIVEHAAARNVRWRPWARLICRVEVSRPRMRARGTPARRDRPHSARQLCRSRRAESDRPLWGRGNPRAASTDGAAIDGDDVLVILFRVPRRIPLSMNHFPIHARPPIMGIS